MRSTDWSWLYWSLFGLGLTGGCALIGVVVWRLNHAFENDGLTRVVLLDTFTVGLGALAMLLVAGWAFASRPSGPRQDSHDAMWD